MVYRSKVDASPALVLSLVFGHPMVIGLYILISGEPGDGLAPIGWLFIGATGLLVGIMLLIAWPMTYDPGVTRSDGEPILLVRGGRLLRFEIPIAGISEVRPFSNKMYSSMIKMCWSYDRLEVISRSPRGFAGSLLISPRDRDAFLDELAHRAGSLDRVGDRLVKRHTTPVAP
jgi:hypothetical protein